jgi:hypothetical protein
LAQNARRTGAADPPAQSGRMAHIPQIARIDASETTASASRRPTAPQRDLDMITISKLL